MSQTELEFRSSPQSGTQNAKLLVFLLNHPDTWHPMPRLAQVITSTGIGAAVHSRIADLRKAGHTIKNRRSKSPSGQCISEYQLVSNSDA